MRPRKLTIITVAAGLAFAGCGAASTHKVTSATPTQAQPPAKPVALTVETPRHVTGSTVVLRGTTTGAQMATSAGQVEYVNGHWVKRVKLHHGENSFTIRARMAEGSPITERTIVITRLWTPAEREAQQRAAERRAAQRRAARERQRETEARQRRAEAQQAERQREAEAQQAQRNEAEAVANGTSRKAITDPSNPGVGYEDTYPGNFAVNFGFEYGLNLSDKYSANANITAVVQLQENTPYQAIKRLTMPTIVRLALRKYASPIG
jgi:hypothetical protein